MRRILTTRFIKIGKNFTFLHEIKLYLFYNEMKILDISSN